MIVPKFNKISACPGCLTTILLASFKAYSAYCRCCSQSISVSLWEVTYRNWAFKISNSISLAYSRPGPFVPWMVRRAARRRARSWPSGGCLGIRSCEICVRFTFATLATSLPGTTSLRNICCARGNFPCSANAQAKLLAAAKLPVCFSRLAVA